MKEQALFLNGVYRSVLDEAHSAQARNPEDLLYLQPHAAGPIRNLRDDPPSERSPVKLFMSTTDDLPTVSYCADIVGWKDKSALGKTEYSEIDEKIRTGRYDPGLYVCSPSTGKPAINLIVIRRLFKLAAPFSVSKLTKVKGGRPLSTNRTRSGGWSYVWKV